MRGQIQRFKWHQAILLVVAMALAAAPAAAQSSPPAVRGTGTTNKVPLWTSSSTIGNSALSQSGGNLTTGGGITAASFTGNGSALTNVNAAKLGGILPSGFAQLGANNVFTGSNTFTGPGGAVGADAPVVLQATGGTGGGSGGLPGTGGAIALTGGDGGEGSGSTGGVGGHIAITGGNGGPNSTQAFGHNGGNGGSITLQPGVGGLGHSMGLPGNVILAPSGGKVSIGTQTPATKLHVAGGDIHTSDVGAGLIVKSPDGTKCARIGIDNTGAIAVTSVTCP